MYHTIPTAELETLPTRPVQRKCHPNKTFVCCALLVGIGAALPWCAEALSTNTPPSTPAQQRQADYAAARQTRIALGHHPRAQQAYWELLKRYPDDATTASHLAATNSTPFQQKQVVVAVQHSKNPGDCGCLTSEWQRLRRYLDRAHYTTRHVGLTLGVDGDRLDRIASPLYVRPAAAGTLTHTQVEEQLTRSSPVACLVALFLLGAVVSRSRVRDLLGQDFLDVAESSLSLVYPSAADPDKLLATVQIFPVQIPESSSSSYPLYVMTDWHPRVLSHTKVADMTDESANGDTGEDAVMYLGPDSVGLVHHFWRHSREEGGDANNRFPVERILDFCTGSGIQALVGLALHPQACVTCVDISPRALTFVLANAVLNDIDPIRLKLIQGDILSGQGRPWLVKNNYKGNYYTVPGEYGPLLELLDSTGNRYDAITANPPFLPVPPSLMERHGKFSDGGGSGEEVLESIVRTSRKMLASTGVLAVVSEFFLAPDEVADNEDSSSSWTADCLLQRIQKWWYEETNDSNERTGTAETRGFLVTNVFPIDRDTYATRRADSKEEYAVWMEHLEEINMLVASPGFLFIKNGSVSREMKHCVAPRSASGSLWTPSNPDAVTFTANLLRILYNE